MFNSFEELNEYAKKHGLKYGEKENEEISYEEFNKMEVKFKEIRSIAGEIAFTHAADPYVIVIGFLEAALKTEKASQKKAYEAREKFIESLDFLPDDLKKQILESI